MPLSDTAVRNAKPKEAPYKLFDERGLYVEVRPHGGKWWRLKYRHDGKPNSLSLGTYPDVGLKLARERRDEARALLATGVDPSANRKAVKAAKAGRAANSFEAVTREWFAEFSGRWVPRHAVRVMRLFERDLLPWLGAIPIADVTAADLLSALRRVDERGANDTAHRARQSLGQVFRYAENTGRVARNPADSLKGVIVRKKGGHFAAVTEPAKLGPLLRTLYEYQGSLTVQCSLKLAPLVILRPKELRYGKWTEIDFEQAVWNVPAERMKMGTTHMVPLSRQAVAILRELHPFTGDGRFIFPSARSRERPLSDNAALAAMRSLGIEKEVATSHGWRATARTILDEVLQFRPDFIEHQLAHAVRDPNGRAYNRTAHLPERRKMMQRWADYLDELRTQPGAAGAKAGLHLLSA